MRFEVVPKHVWTSWSEKTFWNFSIHFKKGRFYMHVFQTFNPLNTVVPVHYIQYIYLIASVAAILSKIPFHLLCES